MTFGGLESKISNPFQGLTPGNSGIQIQSTFILSIVSRTPIIAGNWKMHLTRRKSSALARQVAASQGMSEQRKCVVFPAFVHLDHVRRNLKGSNVILGAQNCWPKKEGAFTGEISAPMLSDLGCELVILGHSECRAAGETDAGINQKVRSALSHGLDPILCMRETLSERESGRAEQVVSTQVNEGLRVVSADDMLRVTIAYEPVWAIGTGQVATPEQAQQIHQHIRLLLRERYGDGVSARSRILYGGSMKPGNAAGLLEQQDIDGGLIGGASLRAEHFVQVAQAAG